MRKPHQLLGAASSELFDSIAQLRLVNPQPRASYIGYIPTSSRLGSLWSQWYSMYPAVSSAIS